MSELKTQRRTAAAALTRAAKRLTKQVDENRPREEVKRALNDLESSFSNLVSVHDKYAETVDDTEFETEESWLEARQNFYMDNERKANDYLCANPESPVSEESVLSDEIQSDNDEQSDSGLATAVRNINPCALKLEKPKLPKYTGDIREFHTFKADFKHLVESNYGKRDCITMLRTCLSGKPLELIKGVGNDYDAAWDYLDSIYGDPRFVADVVTQDLNKFKPLRDGEDTRFCELVHLIKRSYNTLKEVNRPYDMDNNHIIAMIEQKMNSDDRKVWARYLEEGKRVATLESLIQWMTVEMKSRMRATAAVRCPNTPQRGHVNVVSESKIHHKCWLCQSSNHWVDQCYKFKAMDPDNRLKAAKENRACFSCLKRASKDHNVSNCSRRRRCTEKFNGVQCKLYHHSLLHPATASSAVSSVSVNVEPADVSSSSVNVNNGNAVANGSYNVTAAFEKGEAMLPIVTVNVLGHNQAEVTGNVLLDSGAQLSLIKTSLADTLKLKGKPVTIAVTKLGGTEEVLKTKQYKVRVRPVDKNYVHVVNAVGIPCINDDVTAVKVGEIERCFNLSQNSLHRDGGSVDLLVGIDHAVLHGGETREFGNLVVRNSPLGWVLFGTSVDKGIYQTTKSVLHVSLTTKTPVDMSDFWSTETMGVAAKSCECKPVKMSPVEAREAQVIEQSCIRQGNQWQIAYPWQKDPMLLPDNKVQVVHKLKATERRLMRNPTHAKAYSDQIKMMVEKNFAKKLSKEEIDSYSGPVHYIPHHEVLRPDKTSTPLRIVFNSSSTYQGHTLNEYWMKGPDLLNNLFGIILRFRENKIAVSADISKMYHRILIPETDKHVHRFLWRDLDQEREPDVYMMNVLPFGDKPAAAMAQTALRKTAESQKESYPEAANVLVNNVYMDDICDSVTSAEEAKQLIRDVDAVLSKGGFEVKGWLSNVNLQEKPMNDRNSELLMEPSEEKILGVVWDHDRDEFCYKVECETPCLWTKREILSKISRTFDPLGFAAAFLVQAKIGMQRLWQLGLEWDQELPAQERVVWSDFFKEMQELNDLRFERCLTPANAEGRPMLCIFSDASEDAFGTCAYLRWKLTDGSYHSRFLAAKSRVAPLKKLSIPRLELQAAVMATRLCKTILEETRFKLDETVFFTDSMIVLEWIRSTGRTYKPFVSNRVGEIQSNCDPSQWRHIPGELNVADDVSRGIPVKCLGNRWKNGPDFLSKTEDEWPVQSSTADKTEVESELRKTSVLTATVNCSNLIDCRKYSSWTKLIKVTSYVLRFIKCLKQKSTNIDSEKGPLTAKELDEAENLWLKSAQEGMCIADFKTLTPYRDNDGLIKVGGRISKAAVSYETKNPTLLPSDHHVSFLIVSHYHQLGHSGVANTVARVRGKYWVLRAHKLAKTIKFRCVTCRKLERKLENQIMGDLPIERLAPYTPPFYYTSCDYFGPYHVKLGRNKTAKHYGIIFTCLNTRAVHLEMAVDCSTTECIQALRRFFLL